MKYKKILLCFLSLTIFIFSISVVYAKKIDEKSVEEFAKENHINSYSITYIENEEMKSIQSANLNELKTFEAGSISKPVVAYICMQLVKEGKISLDEPVAGYLAEDWRINDVRFEKITIRNLLSHTAGFSPSFEFGVDKKLYFEANQRFSYSGVGYIYLQQIIEKVTNSTLEETAQKYVFTPLEMKNSTFESVKTLNPFVNTSSLVVYIIGIWPAISILVFC